MPALVEGHPQYVQGSGAKPYELKNTGGVHSCTCAAWRNQGLHIDKRTCKHLRSYCGSAEEDARIGKTPQINLTGVTTGRIQAAVQNNPISSSSGRQITANAVYAQEVLDRAAAEGRELRQDEKAKLHGPPILLANSYDDFKDLDPTGWIWSEKLDGVRAYWDGKAFISRQGNVFHAPDWFRDGMPTHPLDGELWMDRKMFQQTISVVKKLDGGNEWKKIKYLTYDMPHLNAPFKTRLEELEKVWRESKASYLHYHVHDVVNGRAHLEQLLREYEDQGAEGLMIRKPDALYEIGRSSTLLKVKPFHDAEAVVIGHTSGKGKHKGLLGALEVQLPNGKTFNIGTGLKDSDRKNPPKVGATITYRYTELTNDGIPKCASFISVRDYE